MASDSTLNETDSAPEEGQDESASARAPGPPRPPRPGKRSKGSGRIPMPQSRAELGPVEAEASAADPMDAAPGVDFAAAERDDPFPLIGARPKAPSLPEESFADIDADLALQAEHAPNAPVTPWRSVPVLQADPLEITPPRGTPLRFDRDESDSEPEPTIVGRVPDNLLELSGAGDENTQAFTAPRELIELARRKREERGQGASNAPDAEHARATARPPAPAGADAGVERVATTAPPVLAESLLPVEPDSDAAPPVKRTLSGEMEAAALPSRQVHRSDLPEPSGPEIEIDPASNLSPSAYRAVIAASKSASSAVPEPQSSAAPQRSYSRAWLLLFGLFVVVGVVLARWRDIAALFH